MASEYGNHKLTATAKIGQRNGESLVCAGGLLALEMLAFALEHFDLNWSFKRYTLSAFLASNQNIIVLMKRDYRNAIVCRLRDRLGKVHRCEYSP